MDQPMFTVDWPNGSEPTLQEVAQVLKVQPSALDSSFGIRLIDPKTNTYTVLCRPSACIDSTTGQSVGSAGSGVEGPYSNPGIGAFGPPRP